MFSTTLLEKQYQQWITQAQQSNWVAADTDRWPFEIDADVVGSVTPNDAVWFAEQIPGLVIQDQCLSIAPYCSPDAPSVLAQMATLLDQKGRLGKWRNELLRVTGDSGQVRGLIERAAVRPLGIRTFAVHLVAYASNDELLTKNQQSVDAMWVQQRALDKATDPGLWDTCAGGLAAGTESLLVSLEREVQEEAGLDLQQLQQRGHSIVRLPSIQTQRKIPEGALVEELLCWEITLPANETPVNQDGEVEKFELWPIQKIIEGIANGLFTVEAALIIHQSLKHRHLI